MYVHYANKCLEIHLSNSSIELDAVEWVHEFTSSTANWLLESYIQDE